MSKHMVDKPEYVIRDEGEDGGRVRRYQFALSLLNQMFITGNILAVRVKEGWPEDATIVGVLPDELTYSFTLVVHSEEFDLVGNGKEMPYGDITFEEIKND